MKIPKVYEDAAAKQRAYRARKSGRVFAERPDLDAIEAWAKERKGTGKCGASPSVVLALVRYARRLEGRRA